MARECESCQRKERSDGPIFRYTDDDVLLCPKCYKELEIDPYEDMPTYGDLVGQVSGLELDKKIMDDYRKQLEAENLRLQAEVAELRGALENIPTASYGEALREGCDEDGAWSIFLDDLAWHRQRALASDGSKLLEASALLENIYQNIEGWTTLSYQQLIFKVQTIYHLVAAWRGEE